MKKIYLSVVCLLISIPLIAQLYVEPEKEVECYARIIAVAHVA